MPELWVVLNCSVPLQVGVASPNLNESANTLVMSRGQEAKEIR